MLQQRLRSFSSHTTEALGIARIWIPSDTAPAPRKELEYALDQLSQQVEQLATANPLAENEFEPAVDSVRKTKLAMEQILAQPQWKDDRADYSNYRIEDLAGISTGLDACAALAKSLRNQTGHLFLSQLQNELNTETRTITPGMMEQLGSISGVSPTADKTIEELAKLLPEHLYPTQQQASDFLAAKDLPPALTAAHEATVTLEKATRLLDSSITEFIRAKSAQDAMSQRVKTSTAADLLPDPTEAEIKETLAALLRSMEEESRKSSNFKLGIGKESNLKTKDDWEKQSKKPTQEKSEKQALDEQRKQQMQQAQQTATATGKAQQIANFKAQEIANQLGQTPVAPWREQSIVQFEGRNNWNTIQSQLKESLTQDIDSNVPESYRSAIGDYFRDISKTQSQ